MTTAQKVAEHKAKHPDQYCPRPRCLWRTGGGHCPRHQPKEIINESFYDVETNYHIFQRGDAICGRYSPFYRDSDACVTCGRLERHSVHMDEYWKRVARLCLRPRSMTLRAAQIVVDAAMLGIGCTEGAVRTRIEEEQREKSRRS